MKSAVLTFLACFCCVIAEATSITEKPLADLVAAADYVVIGKVTRAAMYDAKGREIKDPKARTGPGLQNELRLYVRVDRTGILKTIKKDIPDDIVIPLWRMWHMDLAGMKEAEGNSYIFLLTATPLKEVYPRGSRLFLTEKSEIEKLLKAQEEKPNQPPVPMRGNGT